MELNMKKEIRREIAQLRKVRHKVCLDWTKEIRRLGAEKRNLESALRATNRASGKAATKIDRRIAILHGRLS